MAEDKNKLELNEFKWDNLVPGRDKIAKGIVNYLDDEYLNKKDKNVSFFDDEGQGTVLAINAEYGMGKTYFAKALHEYIKNSIYISVWKKDYIENPLEIISELIIKEIYKRDINNDAKHKVNEFVKVFGKLLLKTTGNIIKNNIPVVGDAFVESLQEEYSKDKKDDLEEFKKVLTKIAAEKRIVIILDELDRCRPDYAVKVLETIKHFFDVKGLSFVLPINQDFLEKSIEGFYNLPQTTFRDKDGNILKEHYLNRFFTKSKRLESPQNIYLSAIKNYFCSDDNNNFESFELKTEYQNKFNSLILENDDIKSINSIFIKDISTWKSFCSTGLSHKQLSSNSLKSLSLREVKSVFNRFEVVLNNNKELYPDLLLSVFIQEKLLEGNTDYKRNIENFNSSLIKTNNSHIQKTIFENIDSLASHIYSELINYYKPIKNNHYQLNNFKHNIYNHIHNRYYNMYNIENSNIIDFTLGILKNGNIKNLYDTIKEKVNNREELLFLKGWIESIATSQELEPELIDKFKPLLKEINEISDLVDKKCGVGIEEKINEYRSLY